MRPETPNSALQTRRYLTTAIPYVNATPHVGFALEMVQADSLARFYRLLGHDVRFQAGTDENSIKNVQAAEVAGLPVAELVERNAARFLALKESLDLSIDDFIRTSSDPRHKAGVERLWRACADHGDIYKRVYRGLYCNGCEQFYKASDLADGCCPEHGTPPEEVSEENLFFRLSRYEDALRNLIRSRSIDIVPESRRNEVLAWIEQGLEDFSISRSAARARGWGIPVPGDPDQMIYVWFDALGNYITALGYGADGDDFRKFWSEAATREHVIGKGITRFHAVYWPAILLSGGLPLPTRILVHGYVTVDGKKIGKSAGNAIDPVPLAEDLGADALRYFLLRHIRSTTDGDFSRDRFLRAYNSELADQLGNLVRRTLSMIERYCDGIIPSPPDHGGLTSDIARASVALPGIVARHLDTFAFDTALDAIWSLVAVANRHVAETEPWSLAKQAGASPTSAASRDAQFRLRACLSDLALSLQVIACSLAPLLPSTSARILQLLGLSKSADRGVIAGNRITTGDVLFPKRA
jgi:methionyl-tRNA synthetase